MIEYTDIERKQVPKLTNHYYCKESADAVAILLGEVRRTNKTIVLHKKSLNKSIQTIYQIIIYGWKWLMDNDENKEEWIDLRKNCSVARSDDAVYIVPKKKELEYSFEGETCPVRLFLSIQTELERLASGEIREIRKTGLELSPEGVQRLYKMFNEAFPEGDYDFQATQDSIVIVKRI